jgi:hypothetical protein
VIEAENRSQQMFEKKFSDFKIALIAPDAITEYGSPNVNIAVVVRETTVREVKAYADR